MFGKCLFNFNGSLCALFFSNLRALEKNNEKYDNSLCGNGSQNVNGVISIIYNNLLFYNVIKNIN